MYIDDAGGAEPVLPHAAASSTIPASSTILLFTSNPAGIADRPAARPGTTRNPDRHRDPGSGSRRRTARPWGWGSRQQEHTLEALLTLATSEAGLSRHEPADLSEAAAIALHHAHARIQRRQLHVRTWLRPAPLDGDPDLVERLAANLIDNAVQHNIPAGTIDVTTGLEDGRVILSVGNTGPVIPSADIDRLFEPFQRAAGRTGDGHGLGLSIVAAIATAHGAALTTRAHPQGGLHIQVSFPAVGKPQLQPHDLTTC